MKSGTIWPIELGTTGILASGRWLWIRAVSWATLLAAAGLGLFFTTIFLRAWLHLPPDSAYAIFAGMPLLGFVGYAYSVRFGEKRTATEIMPAKGMLLELSFGFAIGFVTIFAMIAMLWAMGLYRVQHNHWQHIFDAFLFSPYLSGMLEELIFRAILLRILSRAFGASWGLVLSSLLFGAAHLGHATPIQATQVTLNGVLMGLLYLSTGRLWMSIGMHTAFDFIEDSVVGVNHHSGLFYSTPMPGKPDWLTGGAFGPDGSALASVIAVLMILAILAAQKRGFFRRYLRSTP